MKNLQLVVLIIGAALIIDVSGVVAIAVEGRSIPDVMVLLATSGFSGLFGLLVKPGPDAPPAA